MRSISRDRSIDLAGYFRIVAELSWLYIINYHGLPCTYHVPITYHLYLPACTCYLI